MRIEIEISELARQMFGESLVNTAQDCIEREAERLWHIARSKPKERDRKPLGRPPLSMDERRFRELSELLLSVYQKRMEQLGEEFEPTLGPGYQELRNAIDAHDLATLVRIEQEKPWQKRW